nr:sucrose synthase [Tanacetum cinerariifolium]
MVRLDNVKNLTGLVEWYAKNDKLRELVNLVVPPHRPIPWDQVIELLVNIFKKTKQDPSHWDAISLGGLHRIQEKYTWQIYSKRLLTLAGVYGFWKHVSKLDRIEIRHYLEMFYALKYRKLAESVPLAVDEEKLLLMKLDGLTSMHHLDPYFIMMEEDQGSMLSRLKRR